MRKGLNVLMSKDISFTYFDNISQLKTSVVKLFLFQRVRKPKGVDGLIEINNPNRTRKTTKKVTELDSTSQTTLSRREREELEKQEAQVRYQKLHAEGKTEQAQRDLARLAIIRKQREEAARKKEEAKKGSDLAVNFSIFGLFPCSHVFLHFAL